MLRRLLAAVVLVVGLSGCAPDDETGPTLFEAVDASASGLTFANRITQDLVTNMISFEYLYNGGSVSVGDVDGDGRPDLFLTATQQPNRLYRNLGGMRFEDITEAAGVAGRDSSLSTGSTFADVDGDGDLDLYVCLTDRMGGTLDRRNLLYVNDGAGRFTEQAEALGVASDGYASHATFFDADNDGDLDLYVMNHPPDFGVANEVRDTPPVPVPGASDELFRNDGGRFTDVTDAAGVRNSAFGLGVVAADVDNDGWMDLIVANDYVVPDFVYHNNGDGTFTDLGLASMPHTAASGMGIDAADVTNDVHLDVAVADMMAPDAERQRVLMTSMIYDRAAILRRYGYGEQVQRNMLHVNHGDGTFGDVGPLAGISLTDWSWSMLLADFDNDGRRDMFIGNGYRREVTNLDYLQFTLDSLRRAGGGSVRISSFDDYLEHVPERPLPNYAYRNRGDLTFEDVSARWGLDAQSYSAGAAYADLDGDGDLDLVVNDVDGPARLYRNRTETLLPDRHWLVLRFDGPPGNSHGMGARAVVTTDSLTQIGEVTATRGYYSSVEPALHFGLGEARRATVVVRWPDGRQQRLTDVVADTALVVRYADATDAPAAPSAAPTRFERATGLGLDFVHTEDVFVDVKREILMPSGYSREGPALAAGDVDGDGLDDLFVGGAAGQSGALFRQGDDGQFTRTAGPWDADGDYEDVRAVFADLTGDGHSDLVVGAGGNHLVDQPARYAARYYPNDGQGNFGSAVVLPSPGVPLGAVAVGDADGDGDLDMFLGGRVVPGRYPDTPGSALLVNDGRGRFSDATATLAPGLAEAGLVSAALWADFDGDGSEELVVAGEWMAPTVWRRSGGTLRPEDGLEGQSGWWTALAADDLDGDVDLVGGNLGLNSRFRAAPDAPFRVRARDFDGNGSLDPVLSMVYPNGREYPIARREAITKQIPFLQQRFPRYGPYSRATVDEVFTAPELRDVVQREAATFASAWFENDGQGRFTARRLPNWAQTTPLFAILPLPTETGRGRDLLVAGNTHTSDVESGPYDALRGLVLARTARGYEPVLQGTSGIVLPGDVRGLVRLRTPTGPLVIAATNGGGLDAFRPVRRTTAARMR